MSEPLNDAARLRHCLEIQRRVGSVRDLGELSQRVMAEVTALLDADRSSLFLFDWDTMELRAHFAEGVDGRSLTVPLRMGLVGTAILRRQVTNVANAYASPYFNPEVDSVLGYKTDSLLVVPLLAADGRILGGLELMNKATGVFSAQDEQIAAQAAQRLVRWIERDELYPAGVEAEVASLRNAVDCDRGTVFLLEEASNRLVAVHADGDTGRAISLNMKLGIAGVAAVTQHAILLEDAWRDPRFDRSVDQRTGYRTRSMICVPLLAPSGDTLGVVQAINKKNDGAFSADDQATLEGVAGVIAIAVENALLFGEQERQFHSMLEALAASIDARDAMTAGHSEGVARISVGIGQVLGFSSDELDLLRVAAVLHDYGKIGLDDRVLKKDGRLDEEEFEHMKLHAGITEDILSRIRFTRKYRKVPMLAAAHHEALDGSGYPNGLKGHEIPFLSKIISVADAYESLTADRRYRGRMTEADALAMIDEGSGTRFDSNLIAALREHLVRARV